MSASGIRSRRRRPGVSGWEGPSHWATKARERKLHIREIEAQIVRTIFSLYLSLGNVRLLQEHLIRTNMLSRSNTPWSRGALYTVLCNPIYIGKIRHKGVCHDGQHGSIVSKDVWDQVQRQLVDNKNGIQGRRQITEPSPLAGKLFEHSGERLVPAHSQKRGRRYRYYISQSPKIGRTTSRKLACSSPGNRVSHRQIARHIVAGEVTELLDLAGVPSHCIVQTIGGLPEAMRGFDDDGVLNILVKKVELASDGVNLTLDLTSLVHDVSKQNQDLTVTRHLPVAIKRRGVEMRLIIRNEIAPRARADQTMINAVANGHNWYADWSSGKVGGIRDISEQHKVSPSRVGDVMKLAFLSPKIVEAIVAGRQPAGLVTAHLLTMDLPLSWTEQERRLGF